MHVNRLSVISSQWSWNMVKIWDGLSIISYFSAGISWGHPMFAFTISILQHFIHQPVIDRNAVRNRFIEKLLVFVWDEDWKGRAYLRNSSARLFLSFSSSHSSFIVFISAWRLVFWNSIHMEVASDSFCFLVYSSWLLVFILYVFNLFFLSLNIFCWKGFHFS